ncbi:MAG: hypothetical protein U5M23_06185 [Marinagarivorans sp.]|nr:hypothetical protein [Marinagarivorans sp.]
MAEATGLPIMLYNNPPAYLRQHRCLEVLEALRRREEHQGRQGKRARSAPLFTDLLNAFW